MPEPRRKMFGPMLYSTLALVLVAYLLSGYPIIETRLSDWRETRTLAGDLRSASDSIRNLAAEKLNRKGLETAEPHFLRAARDPRPELRALGCLWIVQAGSPPKITVPLLVEAAGDPDVTVRIEAARGLGQVGLTWSRLTPSGGNEVGLTPERRSAGLEALHKLSSDSSPEVRLLAIESFAAFGPDPATIEDLIKGTRDPERVIRLASAKALIALNGPGDPSALKTLLNIVSERDSSEHRLAALEILKESGDEVRDKAVTALAGLLNSGEDEGVRRDAAECLIASGPWAAVALPALEQAFREADPEFRAIAGLAIVTIEGHETPKGISTLIRILGDASMPQVHRQAALDTVSTVNPASLTRATPGLIQQLADPAANVRQVAVELLTQIIPYVPAEVPALEK